MPDTYRILLGNVIIECHSVDDAVQIASKLRSAKVETHPQSSSSFHTVPSPSEFNGSRWSDSRVSELLKHVEGPQGKILLTLYENAEGRTQAQLLQLLGWSDGRGLGGCLSGLTKNATKAGADSNDVYVRSTVNIGGEKQYEYRLTDSFRQALERNSDKLRKAVS